MPMGVIYTELPRFSKGTVSAAFVHTIQAWGGGAVEVQTLALLTTSLGGGEWSVVS